jgi:hypothetical protein
MGGRWRGQYLVLGRIGQTVYEIQKSEGSRPIRVHIDHLKICQGNGADQESWEVSSQTCEQGQVEDEADEGEVPVPSGSDEEPGGEPMQKPSFDTPVVVPACPRRGMRARVPPDRYEAEGEAN